MNQSEISITASEMLAMTPPEAEISDEQLRQLEQLVDDIPWFSHAQLLLLKGMKQRQHPLFDERLPFVSLYATSRERLHDYLQLVKAVSPQEQPHSVSNIDINLDDEEFEVMPFDTVCEKTVEMQPVAQDLISETLADIYLAQGMLSMAKQTYSKLSLLYPEKKAYFAARFAAALQQHATTSISEKVEA